MKKTVKKWQVGTLVLAFFVLFGVTSTTLADTGTNGTVRVIAKQLDGKIIIGGDFTLMNNTTRSGIARLDEDGNLDDTFNPSSNPCGDNGYIKSLAVQADEKILVGCNITDTSLPYDSGLIRINKDGSIDTDFTDGIKGNINTIAIQQPEKIVIGGNFLFSDNVTTFYIARLGNNGNYDDTFNQSSGINSDVNDIAIQPDGNIVVAGSGLLRLTETGDIDPTFNVNGSYMQNVRKEVRTVALQSDGKIIIGGNFQIYLSNNGIFINNIARLYPDGSLDIEFSMHAGNQSGWVGFMGANTTGYVDTSYVRADGKIVIIGSFGNLNILNDNGKLNADYWGENGPIFTAISQSDEKIVIGGGFTSFKYIPANHIARIDTDGSADTTFNGDNPILILKDDSSVANFPCKDHLVVITHGWNGHDYDSWITDMISNMRNHTNKQNTTIASFDWSDRADTGSQMFTDTLNIVETIAAANGAYNNAEMAGHFLALKIEELSEQNPVKYLHLIAHSAGSNVIQTATDDLAAYAQEHPGWINPYIHLTFLDAYAPNGESETYGELHDFNGYAEQYYDRATLNFEDFPNTNIRLHNVVNFDVTDLAGKFGSEKKHEWPCYFYINSIESSLPIVAETKDFKIGFPFSMESTDHIKPDVRNGQRCIITSVSWPYDRCTDGTHWHVDSTTGFFIDDTQLFEESDDHVEIPTLSGNGEKANIIGLFSVDYDQLNYEDETDGLAWVTYGKMPPMSLSNPNIADVDIPSTSASVKDLSRDNVWDGNIMTPKIIENLDVDAQFFDSEGNNLSSSGLISNNSLAIDLGVNNGVMTLDRGARIRMANQANKQTFYSEDGKIFTEIDRICDADSQEIGDALPAGGECKMDLENGDLVIWTKHFTTFATFLSADTIAPMTIFMTSGDGVSDWFRSEVQVTLLATDEYGGSGVDKTEYSLDGGVAWLTYSEPRTIFNEGIHSIQYRSTDKAGNTEEIKTAEIKIDKTPPTININTPKEGEKYILNSVLTAEWSATDDGSDIKNSSGTFESGSLIDTSAVGEKEFTITANDKAGNSYTKTVKYNIVYDFSGFQGPVVEAVKTFNSNSTIPVRFQLTDANGNYIADASATLKVDDINAVASGKSNEGNLFRYDMKTNEYIFNLSLKDTLLEAGEHTLNIELGDGMSYPQSIIVR